MNSTLSSPSKEQLQEWQNKLKEANVPFKLITQMGKVCIKVDATMANHVLDLPKGALRKDPSKLLVGIIAIGIFYLFVQMIGYAFSDPATTEEEKSFFTAKEVLGKSQDELIAKFGKTKPDYDGYLTFENGLSFSMKDGKSNSVQYLDTIERYRENHFLEAIGLPTQLPDFENGITKEWVNLDSFKVRIGKTANGGHLYLVQIAEY